MYKNPRTAAKHKQVEDIHRWCNNDSLFAPWEDNTEVVAVAVAVVAVAAHWTLLLVVLCCSRACCYCSRLRFVAVESLLLLVFLLPCLLLPFFFLSRKFWEKRTNWKIEKDGVSLEQNSLLAVACLGVNYTRKPGLMQMRLGPHLNAAWASIWMKLMKLASFSKTKWGARPLI